MKNLQEITKANRLKHINGAIDFWKAKKDGTYKGHCKRVLFPEYCQKQIDYFNEMKRKVIT